MGTHTDVEQKEVQLHVQMNNWVILDGYPRTLEQAKLLEKTPLKPDIAIFLDVPESEIVERVSGRWIHAPSGRTYNNSWNPPKVAGLDDITGETLTRRADDEPATVANRLKVFRQKTWAPLLNFYCKNTENNNKSCNTKKENNYNKSSCIIDKNANSNSEDVDKNNIKSNNCNDRSRTSKEMISNNERNSNLENNGIGNEEQGQNERRGEKEQHKTSTSSRDREETTAFVFSGEGCEEGRELVAQGRRSDAIMKEIEASAISLEAISFETSLSHLSEDHQDQEQPRPSASTPTTPVLSRL